MKSIKVRITNSYGKEFIRPACETAELFCKIAGAQTLTRENIDHIKALGYEVEVVHDTVTL